MRLKKISLLFIVFCCLFIFSLNNFANAEADKKNSKKISLAVMPYFKPASYVDNEGNPAGIFVELLAEIAKLNNFDVQYRVMTWAESLTAVANKEVDIIGCVMKTEARKKFLDYATESVMKGWGHVSVRSDSDVENILDLAGKKIGVMKGDYNYNNFKKLADSFGVICTYVEVDTYQDVVAKIINKDVDAGVFFNRINLSGYQNIKNSTIAFNPSSLYFATGKGSNKEVMAIISKSLFEWKKDKNSPYYKILNKLEEESALAEVIIPFWVKLTGCVVTFLCFFLLGISFLLKYLINRKTEQLTESEARFSKIINNMPIMMNSLDENLQFVMWNKESEAVTGYSPEEALYNPEFFKTLFPDEDYRTEVISSLRNDSFNYREKDYILNCKGGIPKIISWSTVSDVFPVKYWYTWGVGVDVTILRNTEAELIKAKEKAEESDKMKTAFLAGISHEIRTPMNGILGFANLLQDSDITTDEKVEYIRIIEKSGKRMLGIINDLIDISKIEAGHVQLYCKPTSVNAILDDLLAFFKPEAFSKGVNLVCEQPLSRKDSIVELDKDRIIQVLMNLLTNSLKFTSTGEIVFGYAKKGRELEFYVRDTGIGIDIAMQNVVFERFRQLGKLSETKYEGSGLGLSISKAFVEMHGGRMWVESQTGEGACFYFTIPYTGGTVKDEITAVRNIEASIRYKADATVLIAEDDLSSYYLLKKIMDKNNIATLYAPDGQRAIEIVESHDNIDIVFMDIQMPIMDGFKATEIIKRKNPNLVVIAQTAFAQADDREKAISAGCDNFITKPIDISRLLEIMGTYIGVK